MNIEEKLEKFLRELYYNELLTASQEEKAIVVDFNDLDRFDPITADQLLEEPDYILPEFCKAASRINPENEIMRVRIKNLPDRRNVRIKDLRAKHLGKLLRIDSVIKSASEVKPQIYEAEFECPDCNTRIPYPQETNLIQKPSMCECGRRGDFKLISKKMFDIRWLGGVEPFELTSGERPGEISIFLKEDLTTPRMQKKTDPGSNLKITGILKELPKRIKGKLSTKMDMYLEANYIESSEIEFEELDITPEDEKNIKEMSRDPMIYEKLKASIAPGLFGHEEIKEAVVMQLFGGVAHHLPDGSRIRGNIHILITGDPGVGKSVAGSSKILHNSDEKPEYTTIANLVDSALEKEKIIINETEVSTQNNDGIKIISLNPRTCEVSWEPVTAFMRHKSPEFLLNVKTKSGREVISTKDHSFVTMNENGDVISLSGEDLKKGMFIPVPLNKHKEMMQEIKIEQKVRTNATVLPKVIKLDWKFGFFLGMFLSEGCVTKGSIYIESKNNERKTLLKEFSDSIGISSHIDGRRIILSSRALVNFLAKNCYFGEKTYSGKGSGASRKRIPDFCFYAPKKFIYGVLSGMFSGDGYFLNAKPREGRTLGNLKVGYGTISRDLAHGILDMLSLVGIFSVIRKNNYSYKGVRKVCYEISVLGSYSRCLLENIKMVGKKKEINRFSEKDAFDVLPCTKLLYEIVKSLGYSKRLSDDSKNRRAFAAMMRTVAKRKKIGRRRIERIYKKLFEEAKTQNNKSATDKLVELRKILDADVIWDAIDSIELIKSQEKYVYDLSIDGCENFAVNNLIVHNSQLLKLVSSVVPRGRYVSGSGVSGAGLTATVIKNEAIGGWVLEAGALILCNKGLIAIDEFDKMGRDDQIAMHEATSVETVSIAKASIVATLPAQTAVLAGANPKLGRFDPFQPIVEQINIPETLLSRFDLKFALKDKPDKITDEKLADHITLSRKNPTFIEPIINTAFLRKYIAYAKQIKDIELSDEASDMLKSFYVEMRNRYSSDEIPTVSITLRQFEALLRIAEASAKIRLEKYAQKEDAERAIRLMKYSLSQLGYDQETGRFDIDIMEGGVSASKRKKIIDIINIISNLQKEQKEVAIEDVKAEAENRGFGNIDEILEKLIKEGELFQPKHGFIRKT